MTAQEKEQARQFLLELLAIPSVNGANDEGAMARYLYRAFCAAGLNARVQEIDSRHSNVIAEVEGRDNGRTVVWNGHLDTVPYGDATAWDTDPAVPTEKDGFFYARGASDMKSGLAAMAYALCARGKSGRKPACRVVFLGTCDEEKGGLGASAILRDGLLPQSDTLLIGEPTGNNFGVAQKGCLWLKLFVTGKTSHGAYPEQGCNAVEQGMLLALSLKERICTYTHPILGNATAQVTEIQGGVAPNMTPDNAVLLMDIRTVPGLTRDMVLAFAAEAAAERKYAFSEGLLRYRWEVCNDRRAFEIAPEHPFLASVTAAVNRHCGGGRPIGINYFTDASVLLRDRFETAVLLFGPGEPELAHKPNEWVSAEKYIQAIEVLDDLLG